MMLWARMVSAFYVLLICLTVRSAVEGGEELVTGERSSNEKPLLEEEMVCSNTEAENTCNVEDDDDDTHNHDVFDDYDGDDHDDEDDDEEDDEDDDEYEYDDDEYDGEYEDDDKFVEKIVGDEECIDKYSNCPMWAESKPSECSINADFMLSKCKLACRACEKHKQYSDILPTIDGRDLGTAQSFYGDEAISTEELEKRVAASQDYMREQIQLGSIDPEALRSCKNEYELCTFWSLLGECDNNPTFMKFRCGPACLSCEMLDFKHRCPMDREIMGPDAWSPGDLDRMFRRLSLEPYKSKYDVNVLSSPDSEEGGPWVLTMENFITDQESERLIELGSNRGYKRSTVGETDRVVSQSRTSSHTWCKLECAQDETVVAVNNRISNMTELPVVNSESLQLLRYDPGQFYTLHHDYIDTELERQQGVRMITVFLYLNDVEAGGGTNFPGLDITVMPKRGRVLIWPHVLDSDPNKEDERTEHQALPVEAGMKYGANAWYHMRSFQGPRSRGC
mmetsp:Transcript_6091/g.14766  ORF Transcript_6091/g.14766 Transcript_6091/m.14766 type:complete len:507 (-) Transcript_6091:905-2425(-)